MSLTRVSTNDLVNQGLYDMQTNVLSLSKLQEEVSSGDSIQAASDNPLGYAQLMQFNNQSAQNTMYQGNITSATAELNSADTAMSGIVDAVQQAQSVATQADNGTNSASTMKTLSAQVTGIIQNLVELGNTSVDGKSIFSGFATNAPAFTVSGSNITYQGTPSNQPYQRTVQVGPSTTIPLNINGMICWDMSPSPAGFPAGRVSCTT